MGKKSLRKSDIKELNEKLQIYNITLDPKDDKVEIVDDKLVFVNDNLDFFFSSGKLVPTLKNLLKNPNINMKKVVVDMGAVRFVVSGADVMRPGIKEFDEFLKDDFIAVVDEKNKKSLAIGQMMNSSDELKSLTTGKVIKNIHFVADKIWNFGNEK